jgi:hypothetical protein
MYDQIDQLVRQANPEPDPSMLNADDIPALLFNEQGSMEMKAVKEIPSQEEPHPKRRGVLVALAAAAVVVLVGAAMFWQLPGEEVAAPQDVSVAFAQARATYDVDGVIATLSEDAIVDLGPAASVADIPAEMEWQEASGLTFTFDRCDVAEGTASCYVAYTSAVATAGGHDPDVFEYRLVISDGLIVSATLVDIGDYSASAWSPFETWIRFNHSDDYDTMYMYWEDTSQVTPEAAELWRVHTAAYVAEKS